MPARPRSRNSTGTPQPSATTGERLQKVLAAAGFGSRRDCEQLILDGRVEVDRKHVTELGTRVDPATQTLHVDGEQVKLRRRVYYMINKPLGVVSTNRDPDGRTRVIDLIDTAERLFTVGRLDRTSEGLIIVTNDGDLANRLTHPRYGVEKTYIVQVAGNPSEKALDALRHGVRLAEGVARVSSLRVRRREKKSTILEFVLNEGRNREIRRLLARVGHKVLQLRRISVGTLHLGELPIGANRPLSSDEVKALRQLVKRPSPARQKQPIPKEFKPPRSKDSSPSGDRKQVKPKFTTRGDDTTERRGGATKKRGGPTKRRGGSATEYRGGPRKKRGKRNER